ncbi:MAG TPA: SemiSWEET transporter [Flavitalea sp.]|nr:SemiSWEET transporter [Flavitalea sp.]
MQGISEQWVGIAAGVLTACSMLPQVIKVFKEKKATQVSVLMLIVLISGISLWIWYGLLKEDWPIILTNIFSLLVNLVLLGLRFRYRNNK